MSTPTADTRQVHALCKHTDLLPSQHAAVGAHTAVIEELTINEQQRNKTQAVAAFATANSFGQAKSTGLMKKTTMKRRATSADDRGGTPTTTRGGSAASRARSLSPIKAQETDQQGWIRWIDAPIHFTLATFKDEQQARIRHPMPPGHGRINTRATRITDRSSGWFARQRRKKNKRHTLPRACPVCFHRLL